MTAILLAGGCLFAAVWVMFLPPPAVFRLRTVFRPDAGCRAAAGSRPAVGGPAVGGPDAGGAVVGGPVGTESPGGPSLRTVLGVLSACRHLRDRWTPGGAAKRAAARRASVVELCDGITAELAAGRPPGGALLHATGVLAGTSGQPELVAVAEAARAGDDVAAALDRASRTPGYESLRLLAGCWRIGVERGGLLADVIEGLADALRDEQVHRDDVALQLAGPRATARMLAGLPVVGLLMAMAMGAHPLRFLFGTLPGGACLCLGVGLDVLGLWWTRRIATAAENPW